MGTASFGFLLNFKKLVVYLGLRPMILAIFMKLQLLLAFYLEMISHGKGMNSRILFVVDKNGTYSV